MTIYVFRMIDTGQWIATLRNPLWVAETSYNYRPTGSELRHHFRNVGYNIPDDITITFNDDPK